MLFKILYPLVFITGSYFLFRSIARILRIFGGKRTEFPALPATVMYRAEKAGDYEIAYKRPAMFGIIPHNIPFGLTSGGQIIHVKNAINHVGARNDLLGVRIVPIASFTIEEPGDYELTIPDIPRRKEKDKLQIGSKTGIKGFLMIFAIILSAFATIFGLVMSILAFANKV